MRIRTPPIVLALGLALTLPTQGCGGAPAPASTPADAVGGSQTGPAGGSTTGRTATPTMAPPSSPSEHGTPAPAGPEAEAYLALCEMRALVAAGALARAEAVFHDEVHDALHGLAEELETGHREVAARLLVAKAKVEADLEREPLEVAALAPHARELQRAMAAALEAAGVEAPACPGRADA